MKNILSLLAAFAMLSLQANDGAYYASGNHLIPISESEICISKEILSIVRKTENEDGYGGDYAYVTVDYTFFNPGKTRTVLVGFEAFSPDGDVDATPKNGKHPYILGFSVLMNGKALNHTASIVNKETYYVNGKIDSKSVDEVMSNTHNVNGESFYYVYHFDAEFNTGVNKIVHTYKVLMSSSVYDENSFDYILTAANRWANGQIDDFTLNIDMGDEQSFYVYETFFDENDVWTIEDGRKISNKRKHSYDTKLSTQFITHKGGIQFHKKNFEPKEELILYTPKKRFSEHFEIFNYQEHDLPSEVTKSTDEDSFKILRNLPYARKGYVFKNKKLQDYYLTQKWYRPNPKFIASIDVLTESEREWLKKVKDSKWELAQD